MTEPISPSRALFLAPFVVADGNGDRLDVVRGQVIEIAPTMYAANLLPSTGESLFDMPESRQRSLFGRQIVVVGGSWPLGVHDNPEKWLQPLGVGHIKDARYVVANSSQTYREAGDA